MYDTVIIGAGIAGLAAGQLLHLNKQENFTILELSNKVGGRVQTISFCDQIFPTGPGWVHGRKDNPIFDILNELGVPLQQCSIVNDNNVFVWDSTLNTNVTDNYLERRKVLKEIIENITTEMSNQYIEPHKSFGDILSDNSDFYNKMTDLDRTVLFTSLEIYLGASIKDVSGLSEIQDDEIHDDSESDVNFRILDPLGVPKMIDYLSFDIKDKVELNCKVNSIEWNNDFDPVKIRCDNGQEFVCKNVIITVQSDLLAKNCITFHPELPIEKVSSWEHVPSVNYCRLFAKFPHKFWSDDEWLMPVIKDVDPFNELILWQNCASQSLCSENENILICHYTSGYRTRTTRFDVDKESLSKLVTESMKNMFPQSYCEPTDVLFVSHLNSDRFAGSFSIPAPGFHKDTAKELCNNVGPLYFAGESVMVELMGTMQAAYISGRNAAKSTIK